MLDGMLHLTEKGGKDLKKSAIACVISNLTQFLPFIIIMQSMRAIIAPMTGGGPLDTGRLWVMFVLGVMAAILYGAAYGAEYDKTYTAAYGESAAIRAEVAEHMRKLPLSFFNRKDLSEITTNIMVDCTTIEHMMSHLVPQAVANGVTVTLVCALLAVYDWRMAAALYCTLPVSIGIIACGKRIQAVLGERHVQAKLDVSGQVQEYLDGIKVVKAFGLSGEKFTALETSLRKMMKEAIAFETVTGAFIVAAMMVLQVGVGIVILVGTHLLTNGSLDVIAFLTFTVIAAKIYAPILSMFTMLPELMYLLVSTKRMQALRTEPVMEGEPGADIEGSDVRFENVTFAYNEDEVIRDVSFEADGGITALVGPSGRGKSTVVRLIARFWDASGGRVLVGGRDVREIDPETLMRHMSFVFQDVVLFNDTVMNNIRIGRKDASDEEVYRAASLARCDEFIRAMPEGYGTLIGENGGTLSGGERQRISIARALLKDAPIVLLDEATASLDPENEVLIQEAISELVKNRTVIVIAHRLRTVIGADKILVLDGGRLVEQGKSDELIARGGLFARLYNIQRESLGWTVKA